MPGRNGNATTCTSWILALACSRQRATAKRGIPPAPAERLSFSSSMAATMEVSSTKATEESRPKAQMPRVSIALVCHDLLSHLKRSRRRIELGNRPYQRIPLATGGPYIQPLIGRENAIHQEVEVVGRKRGSLVACTILGRMKGENAEVPPHL